MALRKLKDADDHPDLFGAEPARAYRPHPDRVRPRLAGILGELRAAPAAPVEASTLSLYRIIFPQMAAFLPEGEAAPLLAAFAAEMKRLDPA